MEGKRTIESKGQQITEHSKIGGDFIRTAKPQFIDQRYLPLNSALNCSRRSRNVRTRSWPKHPNQTSPSPYFLFHSAQGREIDQGTGLCDHPLQHRQRNF